MYRFSIRTLIATLACAGALFGVLAGGLVLLEFWRAAERDIEALLVETARVFSLAIDADLGKIEEELTVLSHVDSLETPDFAALSRSSANDVGGVGTSVKLLDPTGRELLDTRQSSLATPADADELEIVREIVGTRHDAMSNVFISPSAARAVVTVGIPVIRADQVKYVLAMTVPTEHFATVLQGANLPPSWIAAVVDRNRAFVARFPVPPDARDQKDASTLAGVAQRAETYEHVTLDGVLLDAAFARSGSSGWSVGVGVPAKIIDAPFRRSLIHLGIAAGLLALVGLVLAFLLGRRVTSAVTALSRTAEALGSGEAPLKPDVGIREIERTGAALLDAAALLKRRSAERDLAIESLRLSNESLDERVRERTEDLAAANQQLAQEIANRRRAEEALGQQRKMEAVGRLTAGIAHDFNNLLTAVTGNLEMLRRHLSDERSQRLARDASSAAERAIGLTRQLLSFGREQQLETRIVGINDLVAQAAPLLDQAAGPLVGLRLRLGDGAGAVAVDQAQMEMALLNLVINARDAMPGGGYLAIKTQRLHVVGDNPDVPSGDWVLISVTDTGVGMPADVAARAFEPFFTTKEAGTGSGLGLSMVYGLVKQLGGESAIVSARGRGTCVKIYLPFAGESAPPPMEHTAQPQTASSPARVLVVDDNPAVLGVMAMVLRDAGYDVMEAAIGASAIDLFGDGGGFDAVVVDYAMPGMNGVAVARAMRARRADMPVLLVTGLADAVKPGEWPAKDILHKPFGPENLREQVEQLIAEHRERQLRP